MQVGNDKFENRIAITNLPTTVIGYNVDATTEPGEPLGDGFFQRGASVWWKWIAPFSGQVRIDTFGSSFNTTLGVFTGTNVSSLTQVAYNDNAPGRTESLVTFNAVRGTEYQIQVCGAPVGFPPTIQRGIIFLNLSMPPYITLTLPTNNSTLIIGDETKLEANVTTNVAPIMQVDFYCRDFYVGTALHPPYTIIATNFPPGSNSLYAVATDAYSQVATTSVNVVALNYGVTIVNPSDGSFFTDQSSITFNVVTYTRTGSVTNVEFYADNVLFARDSTPPFSGVWTNMSVGSHRITTVGYADDGTTYVSQPIYIGIGNTFIPVGAIWKYLDDGTDQGTAWRAVDFDDSSWKSGPSPLGYGDANGQYPATTNSWGPDPNNRYPTYYYRLAFDLTNDLSIYDYIYINVQRDDGVIVYLNGVEIFRQNMPAGEITYTNYALTTVGMNDEVAWYGTTVPTNLLRAGRNVIAAEVHQSDPTSSDVWLNFRMIGVPRIIRNILPEVSLISPTNNVVYIAPETITIEGEATDEDGTIQKVEFYDGSTKLGEISEPPYLFVWTNPPIGWHDVRIAAIDNMSGVKYSSAILVTIYSAETIPLVQITNPFNGRVWDNLEGYTNVTIQVRASAFSGVTNVIFFADGVEIGSMVAMPYSMVWSNVPFGTHILTAKAVDSNGNFAESAPITITVVEPPINAEAPKIAAVDPPPGATLTNLTTIKITFTERVMGIDAGDLLINGVPALSMSGSGSNYTFTVAQPPYGSVTISWANNHGITDKGYPQNLPFDETDPSATWNYNLIDKLAPYIVSSTPAVGASVSNLTQITITFNEKVSGVDASDLLINGSPAAEVTTTDNITYTFTFPRPLYGVVIVSWASENGIADMAVEPNAFVPSGNSATWQYLLVAPRITLVPSNAYYKIHKGLWEPSSPINQWRLLSFNDALWRTNQAPFYFDIDRTPVPYTGNTLLDDMYGKYQVIYLRHKFYVPSLKSLTNLTIRARADDGFIAWINGIEVYRSATVTNGEIPFNYSSNTVSSASEPQSGLPYVTNVIAVPSSVLVAGDNILAIQAMNRATNDTDFLFELELYASAVDPMLIGPMIASVEPVPGDVWNLTNIVIRFNEPVNNVNAQDLLINGTPASSVHQIDSSTYSFAFSQPDYGIVNVSWASDNGIVDYDSQPKSFNISESVPTFQYKLYNPELPHIVRIYPEPGFVTNYLTQITVEFDCEITNITARDLLINGTPATSISGEYASFTFYFAQPPYGNIVVSWAPTTAIMNRSNTALIFNPQAPGNYWQYLLLDMIPPTIVTQVPPAGAFVGTINYIVVTFSEPVQGVTVGDLLVNGIPSTSIISQGNSYRFGFPTVNATNIVVTWATNHGITDRALIPNPFDANAPGATWSYATEDRVPPTVTKISPAPGSTLKSLNSVKVWFSESVNGIDTSDLTINGIPATSVAGSGSGPYLFTYDLNITGLVSVAWTENHNITDLAATPNQFKGGSWTYIINPDLLTHVIHISIDGCGALYLRDYLKNAPEQFPNFVRLQQIGAWTLNARCDYFASITLPNHSSMFTSLPVLQPSGWDNQSYHGLTTDMDNGSTIHSPSTGNPNLPYKYSVFDVVHDNGLSTAFIYSKASLTLLSRSWSGTNGAVDLVGEDNGRSKIDFVLSTAGNASTGSSLPLVEELERRIGSNTLWNYTFVHFTEPDTVGHSSGWGSTTWSNTIRTMDTYVGRVIDAILTSPTYSNETVLIVTADHGGTGLGHSDASIPINYTIPLFIMGPKIPAGVDLYSLFANRVGPGTNRVAYTEPYQPLRNGDIGNLVCMFLGLPYIPNSRLIPQFGTPPVWLNITKTQTGIMVSWPLTSTEFHLQYKRDLASPEGWMSILDGIQTNGTTLYYHFVNDYEKASGFFRLFKPD
ncbi:MAG: Ig-like domain-containing protein [Verrucomicrobiia bacterium]